MAAPPPSQPVTPSEAAASNKDAGQVDNPPVQSQAGPRAVNAPGASPKQVNTLPAPKVALPLPAPKVAVPKPAPPKVFLHPISSRTVKVHHGCDPSDVQCITALRETGQVSSTKPEFPKRAAVLWIFCKRSAESYAFEG